MEFRNWLESSSGLDIVISKLRVSYPGVEIYAYESKEKIELMRIRVPMGMRGGGVGTEIVKSLQGYASSVGKPIVISPEAERGRKGDLERFYKNLGFVHNKGRNVDFTLSSPTSRTMYWKEKKIEESARVTDHWPVNKLFYNMDDPSERRQYEKDLADRIAELSKPARKEISRNFIKEPHVIMCWRGFDLRSFERDVVREVEYMLISGSKAKEGMLWFTHSVQPVSHFSPKEYALSHARGDGYLLTYPLRCFRSYDLVKYDDGSELREVRAKVNSMELNSKAIIDDRLYELPEGWYFTWQVEKHIGFKGSLKIKEEMLKRVEK